MCSDGKFRYFPDAPVSSYSSLDAAEEEDISRILAGTTVRGIITNSAYMVLVDTAQESDIEGKVFTRDIIKTALSGEQANSLDRDSETGMNTMAVCVPVKHGDTVIGATYLMSSVSDIDLTIKYIQTSLMVFSVLISILVGLLSLGISYIVTAPMDEFINVKTSRCHGSKIPSNILITCSQTTASKIILSLIYVQ